MNELRMQEESIGLIEHANIDLEYARKQLQRAQALGMSRSAMQDCINRAQHALDRIADAHGSIVIVISGTQLEPIGDDWTVDEILAREG